MSLMIIEKYTKNSMKQNSPVCKTYFLSFTRLKMYFNYLTVCEMSKNLWATSLNFVNLGDKILFLLCK